MAAQDQTLKKLKFKLENGAIANKEDIFEIIRNEKFKDVVKHIILLVIHLYIYFFRKFATTAVLKKHTDKQLQKEDLTAEFQLDLIEPFNESQLEKNFVPFTQYNDSEQNRLLCSLQSILSYIAKVVPDYKAQQLPFKLSDNAKKSIRDSITIDQIRMIDKYIKNDTDVFKVIQTALVDAGEETNVVDVVDIMKIFNNNNELLKYLLQYGRFDELFSNIDLIDEQKPEDFRNNLNAVVQSLGNIDKSNLPGKSIGDETAFQRLLDTNEELFKASQEISNSDVKTVHVSVDITDESHLRETVASVQREMCNLAKLNEKLKIAYEQSRNLLGTVVINPRDKCETKRKIEQAMINIIRYRNELLKQQQDVEKGKKKLQQEFDAKMESNKKKLLCEYARLYKLYTQLIGIDSDTDAPPPTLQDLNDETDYITILDAVSNLRDKVLKLFNSITKKQIKITDKKPQSPDQGIIIINPRNPSQTRITQYIDFLEIYHDAHDELSQLFHTYNDKIQQFDPTFFEKLEDIMKKYPTLFKQQAMTIVEDASLGISEENKHEFKKAICSAKNANDIETVINTILGFIPQQWKIFRGGKPTELNDIIMFKKKYIDFYTLLHSLTTKVYEVIEQRTTFIKNVVDDIVLKKQYIDDVLKLEKSQNILIDNLNIYNDIFVTAQLDVFFQKININDLSKQLSTFYKYIQDNQDRLKEIYSYEISDQNSILDMVIDKYDEQLLNMSKMHAQVLYDIVKKYNDTILIDNQELIDDITKLFNDKEHNSLIQNNDYKKIYDDLDKKYKEVQKYIEDTVGKKYKKNISSLLNESITYNNTMYESAKKIYDDLQTIKQTLIDKIESLSGTVHMYGERYSQFLDILETKYKHLYDKSISTYDSIDSTINFHDNIVINKPTKINNLPKILFTRDQSLNQIFSHNTTKPITINIIFNEVHNIKDEINALIQNNKYTSVETLEKKTGTYRRLLIVLKFIIDAFELMNQKYQNIIQSKYIEEIENAVTQIDTETSTYTSQLSDDSLQTDITNVIYLIKKISINYTSNHNKLKQNFDEGNVYYIMYVFDEYTNEVKKKIEEYNQQIKKLMYTNTKAINQINLNNFYTQRTKILKYFGNQPGLFDVLNRKYDTKIFIYDIIEIKNTKLTPIYVFTGEEGINPIELSNILQQNLNNLNQLYSFKKLVDLLEGRLKETLSGPDKELQILITYISKEKTLTKLVIKYLQKYKKYIIDLPIDPEIREVKSKKVETIIKNILEKLPSFVSKTDITNIVKLLEDNFKKLDDINSVDVMINIRKWNDPKEKSNDDTSKNNISTLVKQTSDNKTIINLKGKNYGTFSKVYVDTTNINIRENLISILDSIDETSTTIPHHIYSAYGFSGSGKTYTLTEPTNKNSIIQQILDTIKNYKDKFKVKYNIFDYYGELKDKKGDSCTASDVTTFSTADLDVLEYPDANNKFKEHFITFFKFSDGKVDQEKVSDINDLLTVARGNEIEYTTNIQSVNDNIENVKEYLKSGFLETDKFQHHIRYTPNNPDSSRSHLFIDFNIYNSTTENLVFKCTVLDMGGNEDVDTIQSSFFEKFEYPVFNISEISKELNNSRKTYLTDRKQSTFVLENSTFDINQLLNITYQSRNIITEKNIDSWYNLLNTLYTLRLSHADDADDADDNIATLILSEMKKIIRIMVLNNITYLTQLLISFQLIYKESKHYKIDNNVFNSFSLGTNKTIYPTKNNDKIKEQISAILKNMPTSYNTNYTNKEGITDKKIFLLAHSIKYNVTSENIYVSIVDHDNIICPEIEVDQSILTHKIDITKPHFNDILKEEYESLLKTYFVKTTENSYRMKNVIDYDLYNTIVNIQYFNKPPLDKPKKYKRSTDFFTDVSTLTGYKKLKDTKQFIHISNFVDNSTSVKLPEKYIYLIFDKSYIKNGQNWIRFNETTENHTFKYVNENQSSIAFQNEPWNLLNSEDLDKDIESIHCPLRYQGNFINWTLLQLRKFAMSLETNKFFDKDSDEYRELSQHFLIKALQLSDKQLLTKLNLFVNVRLDVPNIAEFDVSKPNNNTTDINRYNAFVTSIQFAHCVNPMRITDKDYYKCVQSSAGGGGYIAVMAGGGTTMYLFDMRFVLFPFALVMFALSYTLTEKLIMRNIIEDRKLDIILTFSAMYYTFISIIALARGIPFRQYIAHITSFYGILLICYYLIPNVNNTILFAWFISLCWSLIL